MDDEPEQEQKSKAFEYPWILPDPGSPGYEAVAEDTIAAEATPDRGSAGTPGTNAEMPKHPSASFEVRHPTPSVFKLLGLVGWSAIVSVGIAYLATRGGPLAVSRVGEIGCVWFAFSAALWFLPDMFASKRNLGQPVRTRDKPVRDNVEIEDSSQSSLAFEAFLRRSDSLRKSATVNPGEKET